MILLIGSKGSMGLRYSAIFNYLNIKFIGVDRETSLEKIAELSMNCDKILIATPTDTHFEILKYLIPLDKNILCEKPISKNIKEIETIIKLVNESKSKLNMVFQYGELVHNSEGESIYDYYRSGNDGLNWDCLQIIALSNYFTTIRNKSPIWTCKINGLSLSIADMDRAYITFIKSWINGNLNQNLLWILECHKKVEEYGH